MCACNKVANNLLNSQTNSNSEGYPSSTSSNSQQNSNTISRSLQNQSSSSSSSEKEIESSKFSIVENKTIYASPNGNGNGTKNNPTNILTAIPKLGNGTFTTLLLEKGTYITKRLNLSQSGTSSERLRIICPDGIAKLDFKSTEKSVNVWGDYWHLYGIMAYDSSDKGFHISGNGNIIERCIACFSHNTGIRIGGEESGTINDWPSNNYILNCTSFANCDALGQNADGFSCNLNAGVGNVFDGCIAYENCDDGWDLFSKRTFGEIGSVTIKNCIAFNNGWIIDKNGVQSERIGDGNGFKLGGSAIEVNHTVTNCIAYDNFANGFDDNSNPGTLTLIHCSSVNNGLRNIAMGRFKTENSIYDKVWTEYGVSFGPIKNIAQSHNVFNYVLSYSNKNTQIADSYIGNSKFSYFTKSNQAIANYIGTEQSVNSNDSSAGEEKTFLQNPFISTTAPYSNLLEVDEKMRNKDGNINLNNFLLPTTEYSNFGANLQ